MYHVSRASVYNTYDLHHRIDYYWFWYNFLIFLLRKITCIQQNLSVFSYILVYIYTNYQSTNQRCRQIGTKQTFRLNSPILIVKALIPWRNKNVIVIDDQKLKKKKENKTKKIFQEKVLHRLPRPIQLHIMITYIIDIV